MRKITTILATGLLIAGCQTPPEVEQSPRMIEQPPAPGTAEEFKCRVCNKVHFDFDKSNINHDAQHCLMQQAQWLNTYPQTSAVIEGHCDKRGTREYNLALGEKRAVSSKKFLMANGITANRLRTVSYGKDKLPAGEGDDEAIHRENRVTITVIE